jgi:hypothetical protein
VLAVVSVVMLTAVFSASAVVITAYCPNDGCNMNTTTYIDINDPKTYVHATCETEGYTRLKCSNCNQFIEGVYTNVEPATKHSEVDKYVLAKSGKYYEHIKECANCKKITHPEPDVKYYKVTFYNSFSTNGANRYVADCPYVDLVDFERFGADAYTTKMLEEMYVKEGTLVSYRGQCVREADKTFSKYELMGWADSSKLEGANGKLDLDIIDTRVASKRAYDKDNNYALVDVERYETVFGNEETEKPAIYMSKVGFAVPYSGDERADYDVYAVFKAIKGNHEVTFKEFYGDKVIHTTSVMHGEEKAEYDMSKGTPAMVPTNYVYYTFEGEWTVLVKGKEYDVDLSRIYSSIEVSPKFAMHSKTYKLRYFDRNNKAILGADGNQLFDTVAIGGPDTDIYYPKNGRQIKVDNYFDAKYIYRYEGKWELVNRTTTPEIDINKQPIVLSPDILNSEQTNGYINIKPAFVKELRTYTLPITIRYPNDNNKVHPEEIVVQIVNDEGRTLRTFTLDKDNIINLDAVKDYDVPEVYSYAVTGLPHSSVYRVTATSATYHAATNREFLIDNKNADKIDAYSTGSVDITLEHLKHKECTCLCHSVLKPIWVAALNLLNTLFKVEYVCCDDMYASIGPQLNYGK